MANYKPNGNNKSIGMIIITLAFLVIGIVCIIIGYGSRLLSWMKAFGIVVLVIAVPILVYIVYQKIIKQIKDM